MVEKSLVSRQEAKIRELESKLEFERTQVKRLEVRDKRRWRSSECSRETLLRCEGDGKGGVWVNECHSSGQRSGLGAEKVKTFIFIPPVI